jgi:hypothetical protein
VRRGRAFFSLLSFASRWGDDATAASTRWARAVAFLDYDEGAGWQLLQSMLAADWRARPAAADVLRHRFFRPKW